jgi:hypothetical protein
VARGISKYTRHATRLLAAAAVAALLSAPSYRVWAASFGAKDLRVLGRAIAFMQPPPAPDGIIAIAYVLGDPASRRDADAIAAQIGEGLPVGHAMLRPRVIDVASVSAGGFRVVIAAAGANGPQMNAAARAAKALCVTTDTAAVRDGLCAMAITSEPEVEIIVNHAVSAAAGIEFAAAFRMMIWEM